MTLSDRGPDYAALYKRPLKIDIVVHGRFHGFALARALIALGHDVLVHTNYPKYIVARFGVPSSSVRSCVTHGIVVRVASRLGVSHSNSITEPYFHEMFGRWAASSVREDSELIYGFSGVMEEVLARPRGSSQQWRTIVRGSAHIREQDRLLEEEESRAGAAVDRPSPWMIAREEREYALADQIFVLSTFAYKTFIGLGFPSCRLRINPLGVDIRQFKANGDVAGERQLRILSGAPLRVLNVGTFSFQKGVLDLVELVAMLGDRMSFHFVGDCPPETKELQRRVAGRLNFAGRVTEPELARCYQQADLFLFPTIQDGFAAVLLQAAAAGLPILATTNCSAPDFVVEGRTGWILPIRDTKAFAERLRWCDDNRPALAQMARATSLHQPKDWEAMAEDLVARYIAHTRERVA